MCLGSHCIDVGIRSSKRLLRSLKRFALILLYRRCGMYTYLYAYPFMAWFRIIVVIGVGVVSDI